MVAIQEGYRMAPGWHYTKLKSIECPSFLFFWNVHFDFVPFFLSFLFCFFIFVLFYLLLSLELCRCASDLFLSSRRRTGSATTYQVYYWVWLRPDRLVGRKQQQSRAIPVLFGRDPAPPSFRHARPPKRCRHVRRLSG